MANEFKVRKGLVVNGSGSVLLDIQGSQGQLFSVTDQLSGSLFSVNDISGIPVMEAFSDNTVKIGRYGSEAIKVSGSVASVSGSFTGSFSGSLFGTSSQALTASYAMGGSASSILFQTASAAATWSFNHFLQTQYPVFTIYDEGNNVIVPQQITAVDTSSALIYFSSPKRGVAVASKGGYSASVVTSATTANTAISASFASSGTGTFSGSFSGSFSGVHTGSLFGTSSWAQNALTASFLIGGGSGVGFPFTGSAQITGSLGVTGSFSVSANAGSSVFSSNADTLVITGSLIITGSGAITGSLSVSSGITGSLFGTSSWAQNALTASFLIGGGSGVGFPFTGSAQITGSLGITGSISTSANATIGGTLSATGIQNIRQFNTDTSFLGGSISIGKQSAATSGYVLDVSGSALISGSVVMSGSFTQNGYAILTAVSQSLNYADDPAAAAGGVPLGGLYRNGNFILIRVS